jgi:hypothetical protein
MTHTQGGFKCPSPRDYVETKSCLPYEQNPYLTHWVRSGSFYREMSLGYEIWPTITWLWANKNIRLLHDATTPRCSELGGCATLPQPVQPWVAVPSLAWLDNTVASMTRHLHHTTTKSPRQCRCQHDSTAPSPAWLRIYIASWINHPDSTVTSITQQHHC